MAATKQTGSEDWKDKYFKALNELDLLERRRAENLGRVTRDLLGLLRRFRGLGPDFERDLAGFRPDDKLHEELQQGRLHTLVEGLARVPSAHFGTEPVAAAGPERVNLASLHELVAQLELPAGQRQLVIDLQALLEQATAAQRGSEVVAAIAAQLSRALGQTGDDSPARARDALQNLIDHLSLPAAAQVRLATITPQLQQAANDASVKKVAKNLADFFVDYTASLHGEVADLNAFLLVINGRLSEVSGHIAHDSAERTVAAAARTDLSASLQRSLATMRGGIDGAADIVQLKQDIQRQIAIIDGNLATYLKSESARSSTADARHSQLAQQVAVLATEADKLRKKLASAQSRAARDTLTGLPNRLAYNERAQIEVARWQRNQSQLSLAVLDIDCFKSINDTWGHQAGDRVLKHLARELSSQVRTQDFLGRYGGEEFVLILPETGCVNALQVANALRRHIETCRFKFKDAPVSVTISCGVAELRAGESMNSGFERADAGLYAAKQNGRNRCEALDAP